MRPTNQQKIKQACGDLASRLFPEKRGALARGERIPRGMLDRLIHSNLIEEAARKGDQQALRDQLSRYWQGSSGSDFHDRFSDRFENWFLGAHYPVVEALREVAAARPGELRQLFEVGCGDGRVLRHLSGALPDLTRFTGIDINASIIEKNRETYAGGKLEFIAGDAAAILAKQFTCGSILMTYGGVLEYFLESELASIFRMARSQAPAAVALVEPLYDQFDMDLEVHSRAGGREKSFSHPYPRLLRDAGFEVVFRREIQGEFSWIMLVAVA